MGIGDLLAKVEKGIARLVVGRSREPLKIQKEILDEIETKTEPLGRSMRAFPYNALDVFLLATSEDERARLQSVFVERGRLASLVVDRLRRVGCDVPGRLAINVEIVEERGPHWHEELFHIDYKRTEQAKARTEQARKGEAVNMLANAYLVVVQGAATVKEFKLDKPKINIGREPEIRDRNNRVVRRNDLVFPEGEDTINQTVSRAHARIQYDAEAGAFRLFDDQSSYGTRIFRDGANIEVQGMNTRGNRLQPGDEIYFGQVCARFEIKE